MPAITSRHPGRHIIWMPFKITEPMTATIKARLNVHCLLHKARPGQRELAGAKTPLRIQLISRACRSALGATVRVKACTDVRVGAETPVRMGRRGKRALEKPEGGQGGGPEVQTGMTALEAQRAAM